MEIFVKEKERDIKKRHIEKERKGRVRKKEGEGGRGGDEQ